MPARRSRSVVSSSAKSQAAPLPTPAAVNEPAAMPSSAVGPDDSVSVAGDTHNADLMRAIVDQNAADNAGAAPRGLTAAHAEPLNAQSAAFLSAAMTEMAAELASLRVEVTQLREAVYGGV
jgi:hypothetical protein